MASYPKVFVDKCPLCGSSGPLRDSHILPRFAFEYLRKTSATGHMRLGAEPNVRVQDGMKQRLLCDQCEGRLSGWEALAAKDLFIPYHQDRNAIVHYGPWLAKFCASVSWRVLFVVSELGLNRFSPAQLDQARQALEAWRTFMFDGQAHPGRFEQHLLPVDRMIGATESDLPSNINRYLTRAIEMDVACAKTGAFVYAKLCSIIVIGFIQMPNPRHWEGTRISPRKGLIAPSSRGVPEMFGEYVIGRARRAAELETRVSDHQRQKIGEAYRRNPQRAAQSETLKAFGADYRMFGDLAFGPDEDS